MCNKYGVLAQHTAKTPYVVLASDDLGNRRVTGVYDLNKPMDALTALVQVHGARIRQISPWLTVVSTF